MDLDSPFTSGYTMDRRDPPTRKCPSVNAKRLVGSSDMGGSGGSADEVFSIVGLDLGRTPSSR